MYSEYDRLLSFASVHHALRAEKILRQAGISVVALPTPREIDISCGECLLFHSRQQAAAAALLAEGGVLYSRLFRCNWSARMYEELGRM